jgi:hypothetical protein
MPVYLITGDQVAACQSPPAEVPAGSLLVRSVEDLAKSDLPSARLVAIWNALPGTATIAKFKDRGTAVRRLWAAFARLPDEAKVPARRPTPKSKPAGRTDSKQAKMIALLRRPGGASLDALMKATGWQRHTVRGAIAGALKKRLKLKVVATKGADGARVYRITGAA